MEKPKCICNGKPMGKAGTQLSGRRRVQRFKCSRCGRTKLSKEEVKLKNITWYCGKSGLCYEIHTNYKLYKSASYQPKCNECIVKHDCDVYFLKQEEVK